jgi:hypothetical protein
VQDSQSAVDHLQRLGQLASVLAERGIAIYEHEYLMLAFGSFRLELGTRHRRWRFSWDGKEGYLDVSDAYAPREGQPAPPLSAKSVHLGLGDLDAPVTFIEAFEFTE